MYLGIIIMAGQKILGYATKIVHHLAADIIVPSVDAVIIELLKLNPNVICVSVDLSSRNGYYKYRGG
jgi:hypothetical protein